MNGQTKPRFDGGGTEFGLAHRDLPSNYCMFDIDGMRATLELDVRMKRENEGFVEYRRSPNSVQFVAMFEVKAKKTAHSEKALDPRDANSLARIEMAKRLGCRLFVLFGTNGRPPFEVWEVNTETQSPHQLPTLVYTSESRRSEMNRYWRDVLRICE